jgi:triacylglycerol lipase
MQGGAATVALIDGIWGTGAAFRPLRQRLVAHGHTCLVPVLHPNNAVHGVDDLAGKLRRYIDAQVAPDSPLILVGFSLGCIVARCYVQHHGGHARTKALFALSGPHRGTWTAYGYVGQGARDLRPGSALLRSLAQSSACLSALELYAYWTPLDMMILPAASGHWDQATTIKVWTPLHRFVPRNARVQAHIVSQVERMCTQAAKEVGRPGK